MGMSVGAHAQCSVPAPPAYTACGSSGQTALTAGASVNYSDTYYYTGSASAFTGVSVNYGGTLLVCGTLTLTASNEYGGTIIVAPGGSLTIDDSGPGAPNAIQAEIVNYGALTIITPNTASVIYINTSFWNYGTMNVLGSITFTSGGVYNVNVTSSLTVSGDMITYVPTVNNGIVTDKGEFSFTSSLCLGGGSQLSADTLYDQGPAADEVTFAASAAGTTASIGIIDNFSSNGNALTSSSDISICDAPGEVNSLNTNSGNAGSAIVSPNCILSILPIALVSFSGATGNNICALQWVITPQKGLVFFDLESSMDAIHYQTLTVVPADPEKSGYAYTTAITGNTWFRLRLVNQDSSWSYSGVVPAEYQAVGGGQVYTLSIQPNPVTGNTLQVCSNMYTAQSGEWVIVDVMGRTIFRQGVYLGAGISHTAIPLPPAVSGMYRLLFVDDQVGIAPVLFAVMK